MQNWFLIYSTRNLPEATIIKGMLEGNSIPVVLVNKQDSSYLNFGEIEVHVPIEFTETALQLLNNQ